MSVSGDEIYMIIIISISKQLRYKTGIDVIKRMLYVQSESFIQVTFPFEIDNPRKTKSSIFVNVKRFANHKANGEISRNLIH